MASGGGQDGPGAALRGPRRTEPAGAGRGRRAGRGGGSPAAPGPLSPPLRAPHFTPRRPRPRLCGAGNTPCRPDAPAPSLPPPRLPAAAAPQGPGRTAVEPGPILGPGAHRWPWLEGAPRARRTEERARGLQRGLRGRGGEMLPPAGRRSSADIGAPGATPARRRGSCSRESQMRRGRLRGPEAWGPGRGAALRDREKAWPGGGKQAAGRGGGFWPCGRGGQRPAPRSRGVAVRWGGQPGPRRGRQRKGRMARGWRPQAEGWPRSVLPLQAQAATGAAAVPGAHQASGLRAPRGRRGLHVSAAPTV